MPNVECKGRPVTGGSFFELHAARMEEAKARLDWERRGAGELMSWARTFPRRRAFLLGTGPSVLAMAYRDWIAMHTSGWFSVGVNSAIGNGSIRTPLVPRLAFIQDNTPRVGLPNVLGNLEAHRRESGRVLLGLAASGLAEPGDWVVPTFACDLHDDIGLGLSSSAQTGVNISLSVLSAAHMSVLLGFREICLLGVDHGADYTGSTPGQAAIAWDALASWAEAHHGVKIYQCGERAALKTERIKYLPLDVALEREESDG